MNDRYGTNIFASDPHKVGPHAHRKVSRRVAAKMGLVVEDVSTGWAGAITAVEKSGGMHIVVLTNRHGVDRAFPLGPGFWLEGEPIELTPPGASGPPAGRALTGRTRTASGSVAVARARAKVAKASRIWVEGIHDAELIEKVWGDDLREAAIVVEILDGADNLNQVLADFVPGPHRRAGVLLDHLVAHSKESRIAQDALARWPQNLLILGHPYIDVWQAVKPARLGLVAWPNIPRGTDFKVGTLAALGWPHGDQSDIAHGWKQILSRVRNFRDLEPQLLGKVEALIDFVTFGTD